MSVTRKELEKLLTKNDAMSKNKLDYIMQTMPRDILADHLFSVMRRQQLFFRGTALLLMMYIIASASIVIEKNFYVDRSLHYQLYSILSKFVWLGWGGVWVNRFRSGHDKAHDLLVKLWDIRALPRGLGKSAGNEYWQGRATVILNFATVEGWPSSMSASAKSALLRRVVKVLEKFSKQGNATLSDTEADLLIAAARFIAARQPANSQTVLHRLAIAPVPEVAHVNSWLVRETVQSLVGNTVILDRAELTLQASVR